MKRLCVAALLALCLGVGLGAARTMAQEAKAAKATTAKQQRWHGTIIRFNKDVSTLTVRKGHIEKIIHYDSSTKWTKGTGAADMNEFKEGDSVICLGNYDDKKQFVATRIDLRQPKMVP
jgi:Cu/Ag efflux protein CusF